LSRFVRSISHNDENFARTNQVFVLKDTEYSDHNNTYEQNLQLHNILYNNTINQEIKEINKQKTNDYVFSKFIQQITFFTLH